MKLGSDAARFECEEKFHPTPIAPARTTAPRPEFPLNQLEITQSTEDCNYSNGCVITLGIRNNSSIYNATAIGVRISWSSDKAGNDVLDTGDYEIKEPNGSVAIIAAGTTRQFTFNTSSVARKAWWRSQLLSAQVW